MMQYMCHPSKWRPIIRKPQFYDSFVVGKEYWVRDSMEYKWVRKTLYQISMGTPFAKDFSDTRMYAYKYWADSEDMPDMSFEGLHK